VEHLAFKESRIIKWGRRKGYDFGSKPWEMEEPGGTVPKTSKEKCEIKSAVKEGRGKIKENMKGRWHGAWLQQECQGIHLSSH